MRVIFDAQHLKLYPVGKPGFSGGTETMVRRLAHGLAEEGHTVHVVTPDLDEDEQRGPTEFWWPSHAHPSKADIVVMVGSLAGAEHYEADGLVYCTNGAELPDFLSPEVAGIVAAYPVFSKTHARLMCQLNPGIPKERCVVTGLGVDLEEYETGVERLRTEQNRPRRAPVTDTSPNAGERWAQELDPSEIRACKVPGRIWVGNDPARGLWHVLDVFEVVQREHPEASLRITYDFDRQFEAHRWHQNAMSEMFWECKRRIATIPNVMNVGALDRADVVREQLEAQVHLWPSDPPNIGSQIHGLSQMEAAAAGCALVLSDVEAFPELFAGAADILPVPGTYIPDPEGDGRRIDARDYAEIVLDLLRDPEAWAKASQASRKLAEKHTWEDCLGSWLLMLDRLDAMRREAA
jgi:glycosyltransferase involved in cell wall biosynthesis